MSGGRLELVEVTRAVDDGRRILGPVSMILSKGEKVCLIGSSGGGKTTLLRVIAGLVQPSSGRVLLDGEDVYGPSRERVLMFQQYNVFPWLSVRKNVAFGLDGAEEKAETETRVKGVLSALGLEDLADRMPRHLSGGQRQRVALGRALIARPKVLLMDEPFGALDALTRRQVQKKVRTILGEIGVTVLLVSHDLDEASYLGDRVLVVKGPPGLIAGEFDTSYYRAERGRIPTATPGRRLGDRLEQALSLL